jgi:hypothetical protein
MTGNGGDRYLRPMPILLTASVIVAAAAGGFAQRASGLGFSLIAAPLLALAAGPRDGVALTNLLALVVALAVFATSGRRVDRARAAILIPAGLFGVVPGTIVFRLLPASWLQVTVGAVTGLGLAAAAIARRLRMTPRPGTTAAAGLASGFSSAAALTLKGIPPLPLPWLGAAVAATLAGVAAAHLLAHRIDPAHARRAAIVIAALASAVTLIRGLALV